MQLGRGHVNLHQQCPLEAREWEAKLNSFKNGGVKEEERFSFVGAIIRAHGFALCAGMNRDIGVTLSPKHPSLAIRLVVPVLPHILAGGKSGGLNEEFSGSPRVEGFVITLGGVLKMVFVRAISRRKLKKRKKKEETRV